MMTSYVSFFEKTTPEKVTNTFKNVTVEQMCKMVKSNPSLFKQTLKSNGMMFGQTDEQLDTYIDQLSKMDPDSLKKMIHFQKYLNPLKDIFVKVDKV